MGSREIERTELLRKTVYHPNPKVDIAILECTGLLILMPRQLFLKAISYE